MKIYFATSISDCSPEIRNASAYILERLQKKGTVLSAHVVNDATIRAERDDPKLNLYERDMLWVAQSDCLVGEFTIPGGSYVKYQQAARSFIPILGVHQRAFLSPMLAQNKTRTVMHRYARLEELDGIIDTFFEQLPLAQQHRGKFIVLEGIDGCGKDTHAYHLERYLISRDKANPVKITRGPWVKHAREIRAMFQDSENIMKNGSKLVQLIKENREDHLITEIIPAINRGVHVVSIRYRPSTLAYQGSQGVDPKEIIKANKDMLPTDLTLILDIPEEESLRRCLADRATPDLFDKLMPLKTQQRQLYREMARYFPEDHVVIIDGNRSKEEVFADIQREVDKVMNKA